MSLNLSDAIRNAMQVEKNAQDFYHACAISVRDINAKKLFDLLAREEKEHAFSFYKTYPGKDIPSFDAFIAGPASSSGWLADLGEIVAGLDERRAMLLALDKEKALAEHLREMAQIIDDVAVKKVYEENARSTDHHYAMIEEEYSRLMAMVHQTDVDIYVRE